MSDMTLKDIDRAARWLEQFSGIAEPTTEQVEMLATLLAGTRAEEREACAKIAESVPVADRNPALVRNEIADLVRRSGLSQSEGANE